MAQVHPLIRCVMLGILHALFVGVPSLSLLSPFLLYFSGIQAGIVGIAIVSAPYLIAHVAIGLPIIHILPYLLFILIPVLLWIFAYKMRLFYVLMGNEEKWGMPWMVAFFSFALCGIYALAFLTPDIYAYFKALYESSIPLIKNAADFYGFEHDMMIQQLPEAIIFFLLPLHFFSFKFAFNLGVKQKLWSWFPHAGDNTYNLWCDIPVLAFFVLNLFQFSPFSKLVISSLGILSTLPLFMLGVRVFRIIGKHYGFSTRTLNVTLSVFFFLVSPLFFVVLLGFMESSFAISRRFQYNSR